MIAALLLLPCAVACGEAEPEPAQLDADEIAGLDALGYLDFDTEIADTAKRGVEMLDAARVSPGYSLYAVPARCTAHLIDLAGNDVHSWSYAPCEGSMHAELLANGDLLVPLRAPRREPSPERRGRKRGALLRLSWSGEEVFRVPLSAHHDAEETPDGEILALTRRPRVLPDWLDGDKVLDQGLARLSPGGEILAELSFYDTIRRNDLGFELRPQPADPENGRVDLFHANSVESMRRPDLAARDPLFSLDNVLVCIRNQDSLAMLDGRRGELVWVWGRGQLSGPHDAQVLDDGHILVFDNGRSRGWSRVVEVDPLSGEIVWQYGDGSTRSFYTHTRGASQRLPNGNTLIAVSDSGEAFEVTSDGDVVWRFWNPVINEEGHREAIVRMLRYPAERIEPLLAGATRAQ